MRDDVSLKCCLSLAEPIPRIIHAKWFTRSFSNSAVNSLRLSGTYMPQYNILTLVNIMACCLFGTKPLSEPMLSFCQLDPRNILQWNFIQNSKVFIQGDALEHVDCEMVAILSRPQCVKRWSVMSMWLLWNIIVMICLWIGCTLILSGLANTALSDMAPVPLTIFRWIWNSTKICSALV